MPNCTLSLWKSPFSVLREHGFVYRLFRFFVKLLKSLKALLGWIQESRGVEKCCRCLGGLSPSGGEAGEHVHKDVRTFGFLSPSPCAGSEMLFQLSCSCCSVAFTAGGSPDPKEDMQEPRCCSGKGELEEGRQSRAASHTDQWCVWLPWEQQESPAEEILRVGRAQGKRDTGVCWGVLNQCLAGLGDVLLPSSHLIWQQKQQSFPTWMILCRGNHCDTKGSTSSLIHSRRSDKPGRGSHL